MKTFQELLIDLRACNDAKTWAKNMSIPEVINNCERIEWLNWLSNRINLDYRLKHLCAGMIANQVRHFMKDERSTKAVDAAILYGRGECSFHFLMEASIKASEVANYTKFTTDNVAANFAFEASQGDIYYGCFADDKFDKKENEAFMNVINKKSLKIFKEICGQAIIDKVNKMLNN